MSRIDKLVTSTREEILMESENDKGLRVSSIYRFHRSSRDCRSRRFSSRRHRQNHRHYDESRMERLPRVPMTAHNLHMKTYNRHSNQNCALFQNSQTNTCPDILRAPLSSDESVPNPPPATKLSLCLHLLPIRPSCVAVSTIA